MSTNLPPIAVGIAPPVGSPLRFRPVDRLSTTQVNSSTSGKDEPELPAVAQVIKTAAKSVVNNVKAVLKGETIRVTTDEAQRRLDICKSCQFFRESDERCSKCGCFLSKKTYLKAEKCPVGKW